MDNKVIEDIQARMALDEETQEDFAAYDDMDAIKFDFEGYLQPWMIERKSTEAHEALKVLGNIFDTHSPRINILPFGEADKDSSEKKERWAEYHLAKIGDRGGVNPLRQIPHAAGKYGRVALQVDYLPYWLPKNKEEWTPAQKDMMRAGPFCMEIHNPRNVFYSMGKYGLNWVATVSNMSPEAVLDHWGSYVDMDGEKVKDMGDEKGKQIASAIRKIKKKYEENEELRFIHVDFMSHGKRQVSIFPTTKDGIDDFEDYDPESDNERIDILDAENKLKFLNWVIVECDSSPLLAGMHKGGLYQYKTLLDTVKHSSIMRRAYPPMTIQKTIDGKPKNIDFTGAEPQVTLQPNESVEPFIPPPLDQAVMTLSAEVDGQIESALGVKKLSSISGANQQFSTVQAIIDLHMTNLEPYKRASEKVVKQSIELMFKWLDFTGDTSTAYRLRKNSPEQITGEEILLTPDDFDLDNLIIKVTLINKNDKMQAANRITMLKQAGLRIPDAELLEEVGYVNPEILASKWEDEQLQNAALQLLIKKLQSQLDLETQAQQMQMQMEAQQAQMQQQMAAQQQAQQPPQDPNAQGMNGQMANPEQGMPSNPQGQGFAGNMGGQPPMTAEPGMTATQVPGERQA